MRWVNVIAAILEPRHQDLVKNFQWVDDNDHSLGYVRDVLTPEERKVLGKNHSSAHFAQMVQGATRHNVMSFFIPADVLPNTGGRLAWVEGMLNKWPGDSFIIGVWNRDGSQWGQTLTHAYVDDYGSELTPEATTGSPVYPLHSRWMEALPDEVVHDRNTGAEVSRTPRIDLTSIITMSGWETRRLS